jgi:voltage-gated potassium channel
MSEHRKEAHHRRRTLEQFEAWIETPMIAAAFLWLTIVIAEMVWGVSAALTVLGGIIWLAFVMEFAVRLTMAPGKVEFLKSNWLTVIALALPALRAFRAIRFVRIVASIKGVRLVRVVASANRGMNALRASLGRRGFSYVMLLTALVVLLGGAGMFSLENAKEFPGGFSGYGEAVWWTAMLIMSLGTDFWPKSAEGRVLCVLLAAYGFGVFGYITATLASFFVGQDAGSPHTGDVERLSREIALLRQEVKALRS